MRPEEAQQHFLKSTAITRQQVTLAAAFILNLPRDKEYRIDNMLDKFAQQLGFSKPREISLRPDIDYAVFSQAVGYLVSKLALGEAIWHLIYQGILIYRGQVTNLDVSVNWTTVVAGSGQSGGWTFDEYAMTVPVSFTFAPSHRAKSAEEVLTDPDLFLLEAGITGADSEVLEALRDSVDCFRTGLYRASVILLGKAMEGAWIELGIALAGAATDHLQFNKTKFITTMTSETPLVKKIEEIRKLCGNKELTGQVLTQCKVHTGQIDNIVVWSEVLRDARNAIHFGVKPVIPNTYEKVAVLLLAAANIFSRLYQMKRSAEEFVAIKQQG